jgi:hypothetical protein
MKASELRDALAGLMQKYGDLDVFIGSDDGIAPGDVDGVHVRPPYVDEYHNGRYSSPAMIVIEA